MHLPSSSVVALGGWGARFTTLPELRGCSFIFAVCHPNRKPCRAFYTCSVRAFGLNLSPKQGPMNPLLRTVQVPMQNLPAAQMALWV